MPPELAPEARTRWPGYRHVVFDCDSTLTGIEGVEELARSPRVRAQIEHLTDQAMSGAVNLSDVYERRLQLLQPDRDQVAALRTRYKQAGVSDARAVVATLQDLGHEVYVVSGGLAEPVREYAVFLGIPHQHVVAVEATHETLSGDWWRDDAVGAQGYLGFEGGNLTRTDGKAAAIRQLVGGGEGGVMLVGDGESDLNARSAADLFVGFGAFVARERVAREADVFITEASLAPIAVLAAGSRGMEAADSVGAGELFEGALDMYRRGTLRFRERPMELRFAAAFGVSPTQ